MICAIGLCHKDALAGANWLAWTSIATPRHDGQPVKLVVMLTRDIEDQDANLIRRTVGNGHLTMWDIHLDTLEEVHAGGYPGSASHLFVRTMEQCSKLFPNEPILWVESDAIPMRAGWFEEIEQEYATCGKPFLGHLELNVKPRHMAGVAVYPPDWAAQAPLLATSHRAPDIRQWGRGKGQAFDTYAASQVLPKAAQSQCIQQVWNCPPITSRNFGMIRPETALFHQSKDGSLINLLVEQRMMQP